MSKWLLKTIGRLLPAILVCACSGHQEQQVVWEVGLELSEDSVTYQQVLGEPELGVLAVREDVDLNGKVCRLPANVTMKFCGGVVKNGALVGDGTKIESKGACFDRVRILGTWNVPEISTSMFKDLHYNNSLKDVVALTSPEIKNRVVIEEGNYQVTALHSNDACLSLGRNTELVVNGVIQMVPNDYEICYVIQAIGDSIAILGKGTIIGDKHTHTGETGEWGMGISMRAAHHVLIRGLTIKDCWGDCIYIDDGSKDVLIEKCILDNGRRQGISVVFADSVYIRDCKITNVSGTAPEYAIDVEPDENKNVDHVLIENVAVKDCRGGFLIYGCAKDARVGTVILRDCPVEAVKKITVAANKCDTLKIENCTITQHNTWGCIYCTEVGHVGIENNTLHYDNGLLARFKDWVRPKFGKERVKVMEIVNCGSSTVSHNQNY